MKRRIAFMLLIGGLLASGVVVWGAKADDESPREDVPLRLKGVNLTPQDVEELSNFFQRAARVEPALDPKINELRELLLTLTNERARIMDEFARLKRDIEQADKDIEEVKRSIKIREAQADPKVQEAKKKLKAAEKLVREVHQSQPDTEAGKAWQSYLDTIIFELSQAEKAMGKPLRSPE